MGLKASMSLFLWFLLLLICNSKGTPTGRRSLGIQDLTDRQDRSIHSITGGSEITPYSRPFLVWISKVSRSGYAERWCAGCILNDLHVLSAAHCFNETNVDYDVTAAEHDVTRTEGPEQTVRVADIEIHPNYTESNNRYDVAVLKLSRRLSMSEKVESIQLNCDGTCPKTGDFCNVTGWGRLSSRSPYSNVPREVSILVWPNKSCGDKSPFFGDDQLCGGQIGVDSCEGDAGGPLVCHCGGTKTLAGMTSYGRKKCGRAGYPGYYARMSFFKQWITRTIQPRN